MLALAGLFGSAFLAATLLPGASELVLLALLAEGGEPILLVLVATAGNLGGSMVSWWLGRAALHYRNRRWFPVGPAALERAQGWYRRWGAPTLLFAWVPVIGDAFTVAAGVMRVPLLGFAILVGLGKAARYAALVAAAEGSGLSTWLR